MAAAHALSATDGLGAIVEQVAQEKGIDKQVLIETMEAAILKAAQAAFGPTRELEARFNADTGNIDLFQYMTVVEAVTLAGARDRASTSRASTGSKPRSARSSASRCSGTRRTPSAPSSRTRSSAPCST